MGIRRSGYQVAGHQGNRISGEQVIRELGNQGIRELDYRYWISPPADIRYLVEKGLWLGRKIKEQNYRAKFKKIVVLGLFSHELTRMCTN